MDLWEEDHTEADSPWSTPDLDLSAIKPKSKAFPMLSNNPNIWAFVQQTTKEIEKIELSSSGSNNLSKAE